MVEPHTTSEWPGSRPLTWMALPLRVAPPPRRAAYSSPASGAYTTAYSTCPSLASATEMAGRLSLPVWLPFRGVTAPMEGSSTTVSTRLPE